MGNLAGAVIGFMQARVRIVLMASDHWPLCSEALQLPFAWADYDKSNGAGVKEP